MKGDTRSLDYGSFKASFKETISMVSLEQCGLLRIPAGPRPGTKDAKANLAKPIRTSQDCSPSPSLAIIVKIWIQLFAATDLVGKTGFIHASKGKQNRADCCRDA